ncbi:FAD dependent oxidoreductase [Hyaloraphidium curvatum]|nr:FAD dependent oxidoreductase [Hyaloraphidium curvatum]
MRAASRLPRLVRVRRAHTAPPDLSVDHLVVGGGIVGLACAERLSRIPGTSTALLERHALLGSETTSRNSQVIHAGIYYPVDSLKARVCIRGKELLYETCRREGIAHWNCGKWIVAAPGEDAAYLDEIHKKAAHLGVPTHFLPKGRMQVEEPLVRAGEVLVSPTTGIVDSHGVVEHLAYLFTQRNAERGFGEGMIAFKSRVVDIERDAEGCWTVEVAEAGGGEAARIRTRVLVNSAGLYCDEIAGMAMGPEWVDKLGYRINPCKGRYYAYAPSRVLAKRLIYPAPEKNFVGLGIHLTLDLAGRAKFGPDTLYVDSKEDYAMDHGDEGLRDKFWESVRRYLPVVEREDIVPDYCGLRPKLAPPGQPQRDFVVKDESREGFSGLINLVGIESPGLTSSLAIGEIVGGMVAAGRQPDG